MAIKTSCSIDGCEKPQIARGWCHTHYKRWSSHGSNADMNAELQRDYDPEEAFLSRIARTDSCTNWTGWISPSGYGKFKTGGKSIFAHRYAWERANGPIPEGMVIDHACHNTACVNVEHLRLATPTENTRNLSGPTANNKHSGVRNVGRMGERWRVRITKDGVVHNFGCFDSIQQASEVAAEGRKKLFGEFAGRG